MDKSLSGSGIFTRKADPQCTGLQPDLYPTSTAASDYVFQILPKCSLIYLSAHKKHCPICVVMNRVSSLSNRYKLNAAPCHDCRAQCLREVSGATFNTRGPRPYRCIIPAKFTPRRVLYASALPLSS